MGRFLSHVSCEIDTKKKQGMALKLVIIKDKGVRSISPGYLFFAKLVMMSSASAKSAGDARYASQDPFIQRCPLQSRFQSALGVRSLYVERNNLQMELIN